LYVVYKVHGITEGVRNVIYLTKISEFKVKHYTFD